MKAGTRCPSHEELQQLVEGSLSGEHESECTEHLESCTCCQQHLEEIATAGTNLSQVVEKLNENVQEPTNAYLTAVRSLEAQGLALTKTSGEVPRREVSLDFLQPPTDAAYLGRLAQFDVMRVLGRGGMGVVLEAFDSRLQRNVALKVLDPELAGDPVAGQRFCREARAAASITHEHVVAVHQVERAKDGTLPYLVMQLISGESLEQRLEHASPLPLREIVRIGMQTAQGLAAAHAQGLIHRDIKPGNILLESHGDRVKLTDFGLARATEDVKLTRTGFVSGTPMYMAPEQARGEEADHRSDLFSLGAVLYEMSTGKPPFAGSSALAILKQIADVPHKPLREVNPSIPDWLARTIDRLLAKRPEDRLQSAGELVELLEFEWALLKTSSEDVPTVCVVEQQRQARRNRWIAAGIGTVLLALGLLGGMFLSNRKSTPNSENPSDVEAAVAPAAVLSAKSGSVWSVAFDRDAKTLAMAVEDGKVRLWDLPTQSVKATLNAHTGAVWSTVFSPDGSLLATGGDDGGVKLWKIDQSEPLRTFQYANAVRGVVFSPDGKTIIAGDRAGLIKAWSINGGEPLHTARQSGTIQALAISADGETLATGGTDKVVRLWNARTLTEKLPLEGHTAPIYGLSFQKNGERLASVGWDRSVRIWDVRSGQQVRTWDGNSDDIWTVAYSPNGTRLATGGSDGTVKVWNPETGELVSTFVGHKVAVHAVGFSADGRQLASGGRDGVVRIWQVD